MRIEAPRGDIVDRNGRELVDDTQAAVVQIVPATLPDSGARGRRRVPQGAGGGRERAAAAQASYDALERQLRDDGRKQHQGRAAASAAALKQPAAGPPVAVPPMPADETELDALYRRIGQVLRITPTTIHERVIRGIADTPYSNVTIRTDVAARRSSTTCASAPEQFPGVVVEQRYLRSTRTRTLAAQLFGTVSRDLPTAAQAASATRASRRARGSARAGSRRSTTSTCAARTATRGSSSTRIGSRDDKRAARRVEPQQGQRLQADARLRPAEGGRRGAHAGDRPTSEYGASAGAFVAMDPRNGEILAHGLAPDASTRTCFAKPISQKTYER